MVQEIYIFRLPKIAIHLWNDICYAVLPPNNYIDKEEKSKFGKQAYTQADSVGAPAL